MAKISFPLIVQILQLYNYFRKYKVKSYCYNIRSNVELQGSSKG